MYLYVESTLYTDFYLQICIQVIIYGFNPYVKPTLHIELHTN